MYKIYIIRLSKLVEVQTQWGTKLKYIRTTTFHYTVHKPKNKNQIKNAQKIFVQIRHKA